MMSTVIQITVALLGIFHHASLQMMAPMQFPGAASMSYPGGPPMLFPGAAGMRFPGQMSGMLPPSDISAPMPIALPQPKLPVVVMPYYSQNARNNKAPVRKYKRKRHVKKKKYYRDSSSSSDSEDWGSSSSSSEVDFRASKRKTSSRGKKGRQVLTPVVSYVTKDGYVVYQKKIKRDKAKDWLQIGRKSEFDHQSSEESKKRRVTMTDFKKQINTRFSKTDYE